MITVKNLTNNAFDLEGGLRIAARETVSANFSDYYLTMLRASPLFAVIEGAVKTLREQAEDLGIKIDGRWSEQRLSDEVEKASK